MAVRAVCAGTARANDGLVLCAHAMADGPGRRSGIDGVLWRCGFREQLPMQQALVILRDPAAHQSPLVQRKPTERQSHQHDGYDGAQVQQRPALRGDQHTGGK